MTDATNPKDLLGAKKLPLNLVPFPALVHLSGALANGAHKYGAYNWRDKHVLATVYLHALARHLRLWEAGEELADDSAVHHLGHAMACLAILLDAQTTGALIDDRPKLPGEALAKLKALLEKLPDEVMAT